eukprot:7533685-Alexandrium_andersonii.AAC.1
MELSWALRGLSAVLWNSPELTEVFLGSPTLPGVHSNPGGSLELCTPKCRRPGRWEASNHWGGEVGGRAEREPSPAQSAASTA